MFPVVRRARALATTENSRLSSVRHNRHFALIIVTGASHDVSPLATRPSVITCWTFALRSNLRIDSLMNLPSRNGALSSEAYATRYVSD